MRGRPTPAKLKLLRGNPGHRKINHQEPRPEPLSTDVPPELTHPVAIEEWQRTIAPAIPTGHIRSSDRALAIVHCQLWAQWRRQIELADQSPDVAPNGKHGYLMANPARVMANRTAQLLRSVDGDLGLTPSTRARVVAGKPPDQDADRATLARLLQIR